MTQVMPSRFILSNGIESPDDFLYSLRTVVDALAGLYSMHGFPSGNGLCLSSRTAAGKAIVLYMDAGGDETDAAMSGGPKRICTLRIY